MRPIRLAAAAFCLAASLALVSNCARAADQPAAGDDDSVQQMALTQAQIDGFLAARKAIAAIADKLSDADSDNPSPKTVAQLNDIAKASKFANYAEFQQVADNIGLVMGGVDPSTKKYIGADAVIKEQIADIQADKSMSAKDKKEQLDELNDALKSVEPVKVPANIDLVLKNYDALVAAMPQDGQ